ncbi:MAG: rhodanese-like domain-containing protein [Granulosicoccaceae bacterium]|jgi:thiosulfate/3-mercaptopyruvate sulfurtransferase
MKVLQKILIVLAIPVVTTAHAATTLPSPLVETDWLAAHKDKVVILDVRKDVKSFTTSPVFKTDKKTGKQRLVKVAGHIPGAALINYSHIRTSRVIDGKKIDKIIPEKSVFEKLIQAAGVNKDSAIVITSKGLSNLDMTMATRLYWQLKYFGHDNMAILDGGLTQWLRDGHKTSSKVGKTDPGNWVASAQRDEMLASTQEVADAVKTGKVQLVDNRPLSQYLGVYKKSYVDAKGHLPGAKSFPNELMTGPGGKAKFLSLKELQSLSETMNVDTNKPSITYCNSGHLASGGWFIMHELMGNKQVQLYDGSLHEYTKTSKELNSMKME